MAVQIFAPAAAGATLALRSPAIALNSVIGQLGAATTVTGVAAVVGTSAPTGTQAQFTGTAASPSATIVLGSGWTAASIVIVDYVAAGDVPSNV